MIHQLCEHGRIARRTPLCSRRSTTSNIAPGCRRESAALKLANDPHTRTFMAWRRLLRISMHFSSLQSCNILQDVCMQPHQRQGQTMEASRDADLFHQVGVVSAGDAGRVEEVTLSDGHRRRQSRREASAQILRDRRLKHADRKSTKDQCEGLLLTSSKRVALMVGCCLTMASSSSP